VNGDRISESADDQENKLTDLNSGQKRASWLDFKRDNGAENQNEAKRASWLDFKRDGNKRASWLDFKRSNGDLNSWLNNKRASWLDFKKRASWLDFKRNHGDADLNDEKRASWLDFKRGSSKKASWLDTKRSADKRASWLDFKRSDDSSDGKKRASWLDFKRALGSWIEAKQSHKRGGDDQPMDAETLKVIREVNCCGYLRIILTVHRSQLTNLNSRRLRAAVA
jgi:hypothetical protein